MSGVWLAAVERVVDDVDVARARTRPPKRSSSVRIAFGIEPSWSGIVTACATVSPRRVAERGRVVHRVAHHGRVRGAEDRRRHLVGDRSRARCRRVACAIAVRVVDVRGPPARPPTRSSVERVGRAASATRPARRHDDRRVVLVDEQRAVDGLRSSRHGRARETGASSVPWRGAEVGAPRAADLVALRRRARARGLALRPERDEPERPDRRPASPPRGGCRRAARARPRSARRARAPTPVDASPGTSIAMSQLWPGSEPPPSAATRPSPAPIAAPRLVRISASSAWSSSESGVARVDPAEADVVELGRGRTAGRPPRRARRAAARSPSGRRARPRARRRGPGRSRRRRRARSRPGRGPSRTTPRAARASSSRSRAVDAAGELERREAERLGRSVSRQHARARRRP